MEDKLLRISKALCDETRLNLIRTLLKNEKCVCELIPYVKKAQPTVSLQLRKLEDLGIIQSRKQGKKVFYSIKEDKIRDIVNLF